MTIKMWRGTFAATTVFGMALTALLAAQAPAGRQGAAPAQPPRPGLTLSTTAFADGTAIPLKYTQAGEQVSPALSWTNVPEGTQSFVLNMHDPEVSRNRTVDDQVHWFVWNIPGTATGLPEGVPAGATRPDGSQQISASGPNYRGPGAGAIGPVHHYTFELYALDTKIDVSPGADAWETRAKVFQAMSGHILGKAVYVGMFKRPQ
ncbi:MAG: YbhB/YbcL family Raf kinase inhibitor-like protein [Acidobacteriaceae bacterium]|jgi:Raf kinase inhibitor-like YbhB/YbcL family protein|nr:YbhB/YbcL family Raf kinase inhibitor-like protein [Acidobacteriaceae bacterium]